MSGNYGLVVGSDYYRPTVDLSVIIVNYNVKEFLSNLLVSIEKASQGITVEVIVVDNASDDGSIELLKEKHPGVILISSDKNLGFSKANNLGLKRAKGRYLLLLNPDTLVEEDTFRKMIHFLDNNTSVGMAGCKILNPDGTLQLACRRGFPGPWTSFCKVTGLSTLFPKSRLFARYNLTYLDENQTYEVDAISGSFMMIRRECYEKTGGLDEQFFMYGEDLDLCYRVQKAGYKVYYYHDTRIIHYKGESTKRSNIDETRIFYDAMRLFVRKHFSGSFLVETVLRFAISLRETAAFLGRWKLVVVPIIIDAIVFNLSIYSASHIYTSFREWKGFPEFALGIVYSIPLILYLVTLLSTQVYRRDRISIFRYLPGWLLSFFIVSATTYFFKDFAYSRGVIIFTFLLAGVSSVIWRLMAKLIFRIGTDMQFATRRRTLVFGTSPISITIAQKLNKRQSAYHTVIGLLSSSRKEIGNKIEGFEVLGSIENAEKIVRAKKVNEIIFASEGLSYSQMMAVVAACTKDEVEFKVAGSNLEFLVGKTEVSLLDDIPLIGLTYNINSPLHKLIKRVFDFLLGVFLYISYHLLFRWFPVIGGNREINEMIKKIPSVICGSLSLVGPKSHTNKSGVFLGKPGITGLWYTEGENEENFEKLDIFYARNQNIWLDLEIIGKTLNLLINTRS